MISFANVAVQIMNCVQSANFTLLLILLGIQSVSHSQYYPLSAYQSYSNPEASEAVKPDPYEYFNIRNYQPPFRQHQHSYTVINDPSGSTTVRYFGTRNPQSTEFYDNDGNTYRVPNTASQYGSAPSATYKIRYNSRPTTSLYGENPSTQITQFDINGPNIPHGQIDVQPDNIKRPQDAEILPSRSTPHEPPCNFEEERIYRETGLCYQYPITSISSTDGPCGPLMIFRPEPNNSVYGDCECLISSGNASRPLVWWRPHDRCYLLYERGPCNYNEWLIFDGQGFPTCAPRKCPQELDENENPNRFWFLYKGECYKTGEHYTRFCGVGQENWKVWFDAGAVTPTCLENEPSPTGRDLGHVNELPCKPGLKKTQNGECKRIVRYDNDYY